MAGYSTDEEDGPMEESEYEDERNSALNALLDQQVIADEEYHDKYFGDLELEKFREKMIPGIQPLLFLDIAVAHVQATLTAKGDKIACGLLPLEINEIMRDLSGKWMDLDFLAKNVFPGDETMGRNAANLLHHDWFKNHVEPDNGRYRIKETVENKDVLEMMKEGAKNAAHKKECDNASRNTENERPENRARYMHGCNFLSSVIKIACDVECLDEVEWQQVQKVYSGMTTLFENVDLHSELDRTKLKLFTTYQKVLNLDGYNGLNGDLMKHITGRRGAKDALSEPLFSNIGMQSINDSGGFTVYIKDSDKVYLKEDIDKVVQLNTRPISQYESQTSKKEEERIRKQQELDERRSTYTPKFSSSSVGVIPEIPASKPKSASYEKKDWDGTNDDTEYDDAGPSSSGLAPQFAKAINHGNTKKLAKSINPEPKDDHSDDQQSEDNFTSAEEMDGNKDNQYSDDEGDRVRRKKKVLKKSSIAPEPKEGGINKQNNAFPTAAKHRPFYSDLEEDDDSEPEEKQDDNEIVVIAEEPIVINNSEMSIAEEVMDESNLESHQNVFNDLAMLVDRNIPDELEVIPESTRGAAVSVPHSSSYKRPESPLPVNACSPSVHPRHPQVPREMYPIHKPQKKAEDQLAREVEMKKHQDEEEEKRKQELQFRKKEQLFAEEERNRKLAQEKADAEYARTVQSELDRESLQNVQPIVETNKNYNQRTEDYNGRKAEWSDLGLGSQGCSTGRNRQELQTNADYRFNGVPRQTEPVSRMNSDASYNGSHRPISSMNEYQTLPLDSSRLPQGRINTNSRPDSVSLNRYNVGQQAGNQFQENGRNMVSAAGAQSSYPASLAGSAFSSVSQNYGRRSVQCDLPYDNGKSSFSGTPGFLCNVPSNIMNKLSQDVSVNDETNSPILDDIAQDFHSYPFDLEYHRSFEPDQSTNHLADSGFKSGDYLNSGPQRTYGIGSPVNSRSIADVPASRGTAFRPEYDTYSSVQGYTREMNHNRGLYDQPAVNRDRCEDYYDPRYSNLHVQRNPANNCYNAPVNRYDVSRPGTSNSYNRPNVDNYGMSVNHGSSYPTQLPASNLTPHGDTFINFIKFYMIMFARPATEIQWSQILERCKKIDATFRYQHPSHIFGPSYVDQLLRGLPDYIQVFSLEGSNEVIFAIDGYKYRGVSSLGNLGEVFIEFIHSFLLAFNSSAIKWFSIAENNILFPCPDTVFRTPLGGNWMGEFTRLAQHMGFPLKAQKPNTEIYLHILQ